MIEVCKQLNIDESKIILKDKTKKILSSRIANINLIKKKLKWKPKLNYKKIISTMIKDELKN